MSLTQHFLDLEFLSPRRDIFYQEMKKIRANSRRNIATKNPSRGKVKLGKEVS